MDSSRCIKAAVSKCTALWDSVYQSLTALVKEMRSTHERWAEFSKERDELLAKICNLSLILKTRPGSRAEVERRLLKYKLEVGSSWVSLVSLLRLLTELASIGHTVCVVAGRAIIPGLPPS